MSLIPAGLVSGPSLVPQPPLIPPVSAAQPVDTASQSKTDSGTSQQRDGASAFLSQQPRETNLTYDRPAPVEAPATGAQGFVSPYANSGTATADAAAVNAPLAQAEPQKTPAYAVAASAYSMVADASPGMPASVLTPLRGF